GRRFWAVARALASTRVIAAAMWALRIVFLAPRFCCALTLPLGRLRGLWRWVLRAGRKKYLRCSQGGPGYSRAVSEIFSAVRSASTGAVACRSRMNASVLLARNFPLRRTVAIRGSSMTMGVGLYRLNSAIASDNGASSNVTYPARQESSCSAFGVVA